MAGTSGATSASTRRGDIVDRDDKHPAQLYCLIAGVVLLLVGIIGFFVDGGFDTGSELNGGSLLGFEINGWHDLVHLLSGVVLIGASRTRATARSVALAFGVVYGLVAIIGLIDGDDVLGIIPVNPADNILHIGLALLGIVTGLLPDRDRDHVRGRSATV